MRTAILFLILIFLTNILFIVSDWDYETFGFSADLILHFLGAFFVAMLFYHYLEEYIAKKGSKIKKLLIITGTTVFIGVIWEFSEYIATAVLGNYLYNTHGIICCMGNLNDTVNDLTMDIIGAVAFMTLHDNSSF